MFKPRHKKPHWTVTHKIFAQTEPATYQDVLNAYGFDMILERIESAMKNGLWNVFECIPGPLPRDKARLAVWRHLRRVIEEQRETHRKHLKREAEYRGDSNNQSPLNPFRKSPNVDIEDSFGLVGPNRDYNPLIL